MPRLITKRSLAVVRIAAAAAGACLLAGASAQELVPPPATGANNAAPLPAPTAPQFDAAAGAQPEQELVADVRFMGNETVADSQIVSNITTRAGRPFDRAVVQRDVRRLANLGWFVDVKPLYESTPNGRVVIFKVVERPTIRYVTYLGNERVSDKKLNKETGLKAGGSVDPYAVEEGRRKVLEYYTSHGYNSAQVSVLEGSKPTDQGVTFLINEGVKQRIWKVKFIGNEFVSDSRLKTQIKSKPPILMIFKGYVDREAIDNDIESLTAYYRSYGFFQARIGRKVDYNEEGDWVDLTFVIHEGVRYNVRNVRFLGNTKFEPTAVEQAAKLSAGSAFEQAKMERDSLWMQELYGSHGYVFATVKPETVFLEDPGQVDVLYHIEEGKRWRIGRIFVHINGDNPHTRVQTALNRCTLRPGQIMDIRELHASERRLMASSLFNTDPTQGERPKITYQIPDDVDLEMAKRPRRGSGNMRGQSPDAQEPAVLAPPGAAPVALSDGADIHLYCESEQHYLRWRQMEAEAAEYAQEKHSLAEQIHNELQPPQPEQTTPQYPPVPAETQPESESGQPLFRGQSPDNAPMASGAMGSEWTAVAPTDTTNPYDQLQIRGQNPAGGSQAQVQPAYSAVAASPPQYGGQVVGATGPQTVSAGDGTASGVQPAQYSPNLQPPAGSVYPQPLNPYGPLPGYSVDPTSPYYAGPGLPDYPEGTVDIFINGTETQTGRLMIGAGVNSNAGVIGNIVIDERNFDWTRYPRSFEDIRNGSAWRGNGERFRVDASPGSKVSRYLVSWQQPYLLDRPVSLGLSGSYYTRIFRDWNEQRLGGRVALGYQWVDRDLTITGAYRGENVNISNPSTNLVPELNDVLGDNSLHGFGLTLINDTRDSAFLATQGHFFQLGGEQVIGSFSYPRVELDFRKYFLLTERPDHSGRHVLSAATTIGYTGTQTPIYEHFFAGGFDTLRGFNFRGASPVAVTGPGAYVQVGGDFQWLNSVQYLFPITADDMLHGVVFSDFGTVEPSVEIKDFRVALGTGLRITVPAMGPAPIALDFAWAVDKADFDDTQVFSFSLGFTR